MGQGEQQKTITTHVASFYYFFLHKGRLLHAVNVIYVRVSGDK